LAEVGIDFLDNLGPDAEPAWRQAVAKALKGAPFERLRHTGADGLVQEPLYGRAAGAVPLAARPPGERWIVTQRIDVADPAAANRQILDDLGGGADGLDLVFRGAADARGFGIAAEAREVAELLDGVFLDLLTFRPDAGEATADVVAAMVDLARGRGLDPAEIAVAVAFDPVAALAARGGLSLSPAAHHRALAGLAATGLAGPLVAADGRVAHAAGATDPQVLGVVLASAVAHWRGLAAAGLDSAEAARRIGFTLAVDQRQFRVIATLRALRRLWARAQAAAGISPEPARIQAETAFRMLSRRDPHTNAIRTTIAVFAAAVGGADGITVIPHDAALGLPDATSRRLARNTQIVLQEEASLFRVADPAAGSGLVEAETEDLARAAWAIFQAIEGRGGIEAVIRSGWLQDEIGKAAGLREAAVARRREPLVGVSDFANLAEPIPAPVPGGPAATSVASGTDVVPLAPRRLAEPFEALRDASDRHLAGTGLRPAVFLATIGRLQDFSARAGFARNLFEAGGIQAIGHDGFASTDDLVAAFRASGAAAACLCGSDEGYGAEAERVATALAAAGARPILLAGRPADAEAEARYRGAGIESFVHVGIDAVAALRALQAAMGVA
jgi:methylmalonyl-CoA mutase